MSYLVEALFHLLAHLNQLLLYPLAALPLLLLLLSVVLGDGLQFPMWDLASVRHQPIQQLREFSLREWDAGASLFHFHVWLRLLSGMLLEDLCAHAQ